MKTHSGLRAAGPSRPLNFESLPRGPFIGRPLNYESLPKNTAHPGHFRFVPGFATGPRRKRHTGCRMRPAKNAHQKQAAAAFLVPVMRGFLEICGSRSPEPNIARHFGNPPELRPGVARVFHASDFCRPARCVT